jgi:excinuclease ABC subunit C
MVTEGVENQLKQLPGKPGVYLFRDDDGDVLYVGKAKSLRSRVRSYFQKTGDGRIQVPALRERVVDIEVIVTGSEVEALHLEQNLVKRHRPPYNVRLRDDKSFPYIAVTVEDEYPRVMFTRERHRPGVWYFGPYANAKKVRETLDVLNRVFRYRPCEGPKPGRHSGIPCLDFHIDRCLAPCVGYVSVDDYRGLIDAVIEFLSGDVKPIQRELERQMRAAAEEERYEDAARYRNRLHAVQHLVERQSVERQAIGTVDVIGFAAESDRAVVQIFPLRDGKMVDRHSFHLENVGGQDVTTVLESFGLEYYGSAPSVPPQIVVPREAGDLSALAELLGERRGARVEIRTAERGEKRRLQQLADECAARFEERRRPERGATAAARRGARATARELEPRGTAAPHRVLRHLDRDGSGQRRLDGRLPGRPPEEGALPQVRDQRPGRDGRLRGDGGDDLAALLPPGAGRNRGGVRRVVRGGAEPRRRRRRQGPARRCARSNAGVRPAARCGDLAREA